MQHHFEAVKPTSSPDLFVSADGRLVHRTFGQLQHRASSPIRMPDGKPLKVFTGLPWQELTVHRLPKLDLVTDTAEGVTIGDITKFMGDVSGYLQVAEVAVELFNALLGFGDDTERKIADLSQQVTALMQEVGAVDYLALLRQLNLMRANATAMMTMLNSPQIRGEIANPNSVSHLQYAASDWKLNSDIIALLDPDEGFFRRVYYEALIKGDGNWEAIIPDRPVDQNGTTFEHRLGLPTVMYLIVARLASMKFLNPDFVSTGLHSVEIDHWWRRIQQLSDQMSFYIRETPVMPIALQATRRQATGQTLGQYYDWQTHCYASPPNSVAPIGAIDITTGFGFINWDYTQFDEWYLSQGDLHGRNAGY